MGLGHTGDERMNCDVEKLYKEAWGEAVAYACGRLARVDAEEAVSEAFLAYCENQRQWVDLDHGRAWLFGILRHKISDFLRRRRYCSISDEFSLQCDDFFEDDTLNRVLVRDGISKMAGEDQELLFLIYWRSLSTAEAAEILGIRADACRKRLSRARKDLATLVRGAISSD